MAARWHRHRRCTKSNRNRLAEEALRCFVRACLYRFEEDGAPRDQWGCFRAAHSFLHPLLTRPVADLLVMGPASAGTRPGIWPDAKRFAVALSHDVDAVRNVSDSGTPDSAYWQFHTYRRVEERHGFKSAFFVVPLRYGDKVNPDYDILREPLRSTLLELSSRGWEVGLHLGFGSHMDLGRIRAEKEALEDLLGRQVLGARCHYLPFEVNRTPFLMEEAGLLYDTTLGYNEMAGFRSGTSFPHRFIRPDTSRGGVLELPLHVMDGALFWDMRLNPSSALELVKQMARDVESLGGCLNVLWHQRVINNPDYPGWGDVYKEFLGWLAGKDAWVTAPGEIARHWIENVERDLGESYLEALIDIHDREEDHRTSTFKGSIMPATPGNGNPCVE